MSVDRRKEWEWVDGRVGECGWEMWASGVMNKILHLKTRQVSGSSQDELSKQV